MDNQLTASRPLFLADNLALDFINTEYGTGDARHDCLVDDRSVTDWLVMAGVVSEGTEAPPGLLAAARQFRQAARRVVEAAMQAVAADVHVINAILVEGRPMTNLQWSPDRQQYQVDVQPDCHHPSGLLWPVADALVRLITDDKFEFVRQCEAHDCILLFHDLSKSHRRRWCSMATCGNRMKVAAFRNRTRA
ncbi:ABATE domain-containing protein [Yokenella regensburgei]|uniref:CGNR zinc finger domain-containing protein n=1 Tax=Yokenella regensburgei TaxID=158877 RepID=UPI003F143160